MVATTSIYDFKVEALKGSEKEIVDFSAFKEKKILVVNTASECGFTPQYASLQELYNLYSNKDFVIVGVPSNDFGGQEPGSEEQIASFCSKNFGVTFPMTTKLTVKGSEMHPLYQWLTKKEQNSFKDSEVKWNFQKYLIDQKGNLIAVFPHNLDPLSKDIVSLIEQ